MRQPWTTQDTAFLVALIASCVAFAAGLAHALEMPAKMRLDVADYFVTQALYRGWDRLGVLIAVELFAILWVIVATRGDPPARRLGFLALAGLVAAQVIFWTWTFPANRATSNWTVVPQGWEQLRRQWEFSHFAGALCQGIAFIALAVAALSRERPP